MNGTARAIVFFLWAGAVLLAGSRSVRAQESAVESTNRLVINADKLDYDRNRELIVYTGNVFMTKGDMELKADHVTLDRKTSVVEATGDTSLKRGLMTWEGDRLQYNMDTHAVKGERFAAAFPPYHVWGKSAEKGTGTTYAIRSATFSTCQEPFGHLHYHTWSWKATVEPDSYLKACHSVLFLGPVPFFYIPWMRRTLGEESLGINIQPGYQSRMGYYLLSEFSYKFTHQFSASTMVDYRTLRGFAGGEEFDWKTPGGGGRLHVYLANDTGTDDPDNNYPDNRIPDPSRHRFFIRQAEQLGDGWSAMGELNTFSDEFVLEDFYRREFQNNPDPLNYGLISHVQDNQAFSLLAKGRLDDFYSTVSRLPEVRHEVFLTPISDSGFYYEGYNDAAWLMRQYASHLDEEDVSLMRLDSRQFVTRPIPVGIFNAVPRAGVQATWFSKTRDTEMTEREVKNMVTNTLPDGTVVVADGIQRIELIKAGGAKLRPLFEVGTEASFKAFRLWAGGSEESPVRYRHIAEPYLNYTLRPDLLSQSPEDFYQFDGVDRIGAEHSLRLGMRNAVQFKRDDRIYELFDADLYSTYYLESQTEDTGLGPFVLNVESRPADGVFIELNADYDTHAGEITQWNIRGQFKPHPMWQFGGEYRYHLDLDSLATGTLRYMPSESWAFEVYERYNINESRFEEHGYEIDRLLDCMGMKFGFTYDPSYVMINGKTRDANFNVHVELWLTAFPNTHWGSHR